MNNNEEKIVSEKAERVRAWLKRPENLIIVLILIGAFGLKLYYLNLADGQTLWWDEAEYMSSAKHWALGVPYELNPQRPPLFQLLASILINLGFGEFSLKFLLVLLPATIFIYLIYLLGKELFNAKIGIFAALASAGMWSYLFWGARFQPDFFSLCFQLLSLIFFWKLIKKPEKKYAIYAGLFAALGLYFKISALLIPVIMLVFAFWYEKFAFLKKKIYWLILASFLIALVPLGILQYSSFGSPTEFAKSYTWGNGVDVENRPLGWQAIDFFYSFSKGLFFILFITGAISTIFKLSLTFDLIMKDKEKRISPEIFSLIVLIIVVCFYVFYIQGIIEDRWVFIIAPFIFIFAGKGLFSIIKLFKLNGKGISALIIVVLFCIFFYMQIGHASDLIKNKIPSYSEIKDSAMWIKENSNFGEAIVSKSYTQMTAYSERKVYPFSQCPYYCSDYQNESSFIEFLKKEKPRYIVLSGFEGHPQWAFQSGQNQQGLMIIAMPFLNSTIATDSKGQIVHNDIKQNVEKEGLEFKLVYPKQQLNGVFIYEVKYS